MIISAKQQHDILHCCIVSLKLVFVLTERASYSINSHVRRRSSRNLYFASPCAPRSRQHSRREPRCPRW